MSTARQVPETIELTGDDARHVLAHAGYRRLMRDAFMRLRVADGFSHARSLAFALTLVLVQGTIALVGLASAAGVGALRQGILTTFRAAPGPIGALLADAVHQAQRAGTTGQYLGLAFGLVGAIITGATFMGQLERGMNRIYGVEQDRPTLAKYGLATLLALTAGVLATAAFAAIALGRGIGNAISSDASGVAWSILRWPLGALLSMAATALLFRWAPRRRQPAWSWLAFGASVSVVLWILTAASLTGLFDYSSTFGQTYGSLAGIVALQLWALLSSIALLYGAAIAAQLEAVRVGAPETQDEVKVTHSEPEPQDASLMSAGTSP